MTGGTQGAAMPPPLPLYCESQPQAPMTDTVQISDNWEIPVDLNDEIGKIEDLMDRTHPYLFHYSFLSDGSHEWAEEIAVDGILSQRPHEEIVREIFDNYDPTPDSVEIGYFF